MKKNNIILSIPYNMSFRNLTFSTFEFNKKKYNYVLFTSIKKEMLASVSNIKFSKIFNYSVTGRFFRAIYFILASIITNSVVNRKRWKTMNLIKKKLQNKDKIDDIIRSDYKFCFSKISTFISNNFFFLSLIKTLCSILLFFFSIRYLILLIILKPKCILFFHLHASHDKGLLIAAKILNIETHGVVHSWDNPTTKLILPFQTSKTYVWNKFLKNEISYLNNIHRKNIFTIGIPQFDFYKNIQKRKINKKKIKLLIFLPSPGLVQNTIQKNSLEQIYKFLKKIKYFELIIRTHPGITPKWLQKFKKQNKNIHINQPTSLFVADTNKDKIKKNDFINYELEDIINNCDLTANFFSTTSLDAIYLDKPVLSLNFDITKKNRLNWYYNWSHQKNLMKFNATSICKSIDDLKKEFFKYVNNPNYKKYQRRVVREKFCVFTDGFSGRRLSSIFHKNIS